MNFYNILVFCYQLIKQLIILLIKNQKNRIRYFFIRTNPFILTIYLISILLFFHLLKKRTEMRFSHFILEELGGTRNMEELVKYDINTTLHQPEMICNFKGKWTQLVILVRSKPENKGRRDEIRETWKNFVLEYGRKVEFFFFLGTSSSSSVSWNELLEESKRHRDIIIENTEENAYRETVKTLRLLKWFEKNCGLAKTLLKAEDNAFVHVKRFYAYNRWELQTKILGPYYLGGFIVDNLKVDRDTSSSQFIPSNFLLRDNSLEIHYNYYYPRHLRGDCYVLKGELVKPLLEASRSSPYFPIENIFISGVLPAQIPLALDEWPNVIYENTKNLNIIVNGLNPDLIPEEEDPRHSFCYIPNPNNGSSLKQILHFIKANPLNYPIDID